MPRRTCLLVLLGLLGGLLPIRARAHALTITQLLVSFDQPGTIDVKVDLDLTNLLGSPEAYYALSQATPEAQQQGIGRLLAGITNDLQVHFGDARPALIFQGYALPALSKADYLDPTVDHFTTLHFIAILPATRDPIRLVVRPGARVDYPVAFIVQIPSAHISEASWIEDESEESDSFDWADVAPKAGAALAAAPAPSGVKAPAGSPATIRTHAEPAFDVDALPWPHQLSMYLRLGFHHIVPEGTDHILFVLGLFFLGITWRKLLSQTSVFTVAHATTLFLSTYGIFSLPSKFVEPAIALSIAFIALENVFSPKLGVGRLAVVFCFGLIHGLGFASSLSDVPFPKHQFIVALLGFNFGVDAGQLFVIALAFLAVGWFRNRSWFRARIAIPCSVTIAAIGVFWAVQRVIFYRQLY
jgi:HupE / UreJ protein